ncbi:MAG: hypothetical protein RL226_528 [Bacteroidota bacterium]
MCVLIGLSPFAMHAQEKRDCLDATLKKSKDENICHYFRSSKLGEDGLYYVQVEYLAGTLKMSGSYIDAALTIEDGHFVYYYRNGQVESEGVYKHGRKVGVWSRYFFDGSVRPDRIYPELSESTSHETPATFPAGYEGFMSFLAENLHYPPPAITKEMNGYARAAFVIQASGKITDIEILESSHFFFDRAVMECLWTMPDWLPAERQGRPVQSTFILPVTFAIHEGETRISIGDEID